MLTRILDSHPDLWVTYDSVHFFRYTFKKYDPISDPANMKLAVNEIYDRISSRWEMNFDKNIVLANLLSQPSINYKDVYNEVMIALLNNYKPTAKSWGEKTVLAWSKIKDFLKMFPDGKIIHILRDPRDVLCSFKKLTTAPYPGYLNTAFVALDSFISCMNHQHEFAPSNFTCIRYEDLVNKPENTVIDICNFLEISFDINMLNTNKFTDKTNNSWTGNSAFNMETCSINNNSVNRWTDIASPIEIYLIELINSKMLSAFDYPTSDIKLNKSDLNHLKGLLDNECLKDKYSWWLKSQQGIEGWSTDDNLTNFSSTKPYINIVQTKQN
ncbi:MAG: sulfotransferase [Desulfobacterales bacterium]|nr:sulfotransferase [Desulfobacterales bacterium]